MSTSCNAVFQLASGKNPFVNQPIPIHELLMTDDTQAGDAGSESRQRSASRDGHGARVDRSQGTERLRV
ncbi:MAG: hypothetical protein J6S33_03925 [Aeriscardovia sp.]|nr:hypothetical protein [Aeriscardovia sp.]